MSILGRILCIFLRFPSGRESEHGIDVLPPTSLWARAEHDINIKFVPRDSDCSDGIGEMGRGLPSVLSKHGRSCQRTPQVDDRTGGRNAQGVGTPRRGGAMLERRWTSASWSREKQWSRYS